jgi:hypothetical protein
MTSWRSQAGPPPSVPPDAMARRLPTWGSWHIGWYLVVLMTPVVPVRSRATIWCRKDSLSRCSTTSTLLIIQPTVIFGPNWLI